MNSGDDVKINLLLLLRLQLVEARLNANWQQFLSVPAARAYTTAMGTETATNETEHDVSLLVDMLLSHQVRGLQVTKEPSWKPRVLRRSKSSDLVIVVILVANACSQTLFAAFSSSVSGEQEAMSSLLMRPPRRGRDRHRAAASLLIHSRLPPHDER